MAEILRFVDPNASAGGDGTTNSLTGGNCAYVSLSAWEAATQQDLTDGGGDTARVVCSSDDAGSTHLADTTAVVIDGWTTGASNYITIEAASSHGGKWNDNIYRLTNSTASVTALTIVNPNVVRLVGFQCKSSTTANARAVGTSTDSASTVTITKCIFVASGFAFRMWAYSGTYTAINSIFISGAYDSGTVTGLAHLNIYNCTIINTAAYPALWRQSETWTAKNCYAASNGGAAYSGTITKTTCASSDATGSAGLQNIVLNTTNFTNVTAGSEDFHLPAGSALIDVGTDTSGDAAPLNFTDDIDGVTRTGTWDIGADEYVAAGVVLTSPVDTSTGLGYPVVFSWQAYAGAVQYELQVSPNADFSSPVMDVFTTNTTYSATPADGVALGTHYYWRVRASR